MILEAKAKINLTLDITGKRDDGYHNLDTVMQTISLSDTIDLTKNKEPGINLSCSKISLPVDIHNTAYKAAKLLLEYCNITDMGVNIHIIKNIPSQAGLGGGSADAAAVLNGMNKLFELNLTKKELAKIAVKVGADVAFCLESGTARCLGIGDIIKEASSLPDCYLLVCKPEIGVSTPYAYELSDRYPQEDYFLTPSMIDALETGNIENVAQCIGNRFDDILCISDVQIIKSIMIDSGALNASMTGSGSAVFGIFKDENSMRDAGFRLADLGEVFYCKAQNA